MPLFDLDDRQQNSIGTREYWRAFEAFDGSPLHAALVQAIAPYLNHESINSMQIGSTTLSRLETESPELFRPYQHDEIGGLFGMTLWNIIAERPEDWRFYRLTNEMDEAWGTVYFRRR